MGKFRIFTLGFVIYFLFVGCQKKTTESPVLNDPSTGNIRFEFVQMMDNELIDFESAQNIYLTSGGDSIMINLIAYYISNVILTDSLDQSFVVKNSYHLIKYSANENKTHFTISQVPIGIYKSIQFSVGVDSAKNHVIDNVGDLDPFNLMGWPWNIGYKFFVLDGTYVSGDNTEPITYHVGEDINFKTINKIFNESGFSTVNVEVDKTSTIRIKLNLSTVLAGMPLSDPRNRAIMEGVLATQVANNYANGGFSLQNVVNP